MFTDPVKNLRALGLRENDIVVDLGAGTGFYSLAAARIATKGKIYAIEINKDYLATIKHKVKETHLNNVEILWGNVEQIGGTKVASEVADAAIASNVFFQTEDQENFILEIKRILKPEGKLLFIDWAEASFMTAKHVVPKDKVLEMFTKKGFIKERELDAGAHHYGMILIRK